MTFILKLISTISCYNFVSKVFLLVQGHKEVYVEIKYENIIIYDNFNKTVNPYMLYLGQVIKLNLNCFLSS